MKRERERSDQERRWPQKKQTKKHTPKNENIHQKKQKKKTTKKKNNNKKNYQTTLNQIPQTPQTPPPPPKE